MSKKGDFLTGFSGGSTQEPLTEQKEAPVMDKPTERLKTDIKKDVSAKTNVAENKKLADKIVADIEKKANTRVGTPTRPAQGANAIIRAPEHTITKDEKFHKRKMVKYGMIGTISIATIVLVFFLVRVLTSVEVLDFSGVPLREAQEWGMLNSISIEPTREYSLDFDEGEIIRQSHEPGTSLSPRSVLSVVVSDGPDMNEVIELPEDLEEMTRAEITTWRNNNGFTASSIAFSDEASTEVEANHVIRIEIPNDVDINHFTRSDRLTIVFSSGPEIVQMPDFRAEGRNTREFVENWKAENPGIDVEIEDEPSETVDRDIVLGQSHAPQQNITEGMTVTIRISVGQPIIVPNFADIPRNDAENPETTSAIPERLNVDVRRRYSSVVPFGRFVSQSFEPGHELFGENPLVVVIYSEGLPWVSRIETEETIAETMFDFNSQGAFMTFRIDYVDSDQPRGTVVNQSMYNQRVALDAHIVFRVSRGNLAPPESPEPNFPGGGADVDTGPGGDNDVDGG